MSRLFRSPGDAALGLIPAAALAIAALLVTAAVTRADDLGQTPQWNIVASVTHVGGKVTKHPYAPDGVENLVIDSKQECDELLRSSVKIGLASAGLIDFLLRREPGATVVFACEPSTVPPPKKESAPT